MKICASPAGRISFFTHFMFSAGLFARNKTSLHLVSWLSQAQKTPIVFSPFPCYIHLSFYRLISKIQQATVCAESCQNIPYAAEGLTGHGMLLLPSSTVCNSELGWIRSICRTNHKPSWLFFTQNTESLISHLESGQSVKQRFSDLL